LGYDPIILARDDTHEHKTLWRLKASLNYWEWLKGKLQAEGNQVVSVLAS